MNVQTYLAVHWYVYADKQRVSAAGQVDRVRSRSVPCRNRPAAATKTSNGSVRGWSPRMTENRIAGISLGFLRRR
jgi:hypothetical protein